jgi:hypothetical protein
MLKKSSPLKQLGQMEPNLAGSIYVRSKPGIDGTWVCPFQNCVRQPHPPCRTVRDIDVVFKTNNPAFADIIIDIDRIHYLSIEGELSDIETIYYHPHNDLSSAVPAPLVASVVLI